MRDPLAGSWSRGLGPIESLPPRAELLAAIGARVGRGLEWEGPWFDASIGLREENGRLLADCRVSLSRPARMASFAVGIIMAIPVVACGMDGALMRLVGLLLLAVCFLAAVQLAARVRVGWTLRRAMAQVRARRPRRLPRAKARFRTR
ncbi:MAG TPA: hypothetical protein VKB80_01155 [Kofleriaceae bacterium]|nr:hypothetical protein [Kofleriaceae bacterium]